MDKQKERKPVDDAGLTMGNIAMIALNAAGLMGRVENGF